MRMVLPEDTESFLDGVFRPFLDGRDPSVSKGSAAARSPVLLPVPTGTTNLGLLLEGDGVLVAPDLNDIAHSATGAPERYIDVALRDVLVAKQGWNRLAEHRPNVVAVNLGLSPDYQMAIERQRELRLAKPEFDLPSDIDAVALSVCGVNEDRARFHGAHVRDRAHPGLPLLGLA